MSDADSTSNDRDEPATIAYGSKFATAFVKFQADLQTVKKDGKANAGQYGYTYATLDKIIEAVRKPLGDNGLSFTQPLSTSADGKVLITTIIRHESGEQQTSSVEVDVRGKTPQQIGSVFTYFKRYSLGAALGIATEEDDDGSAGNQPAARPAPAPAATSAPAKTNPVGVISRAQLGKMQAGFTDLGIEGREDKLEYISQIVKRTVTSSQDLSMNEARKVIDAQLKELSERDGGE